jgi:hypothetical protein
MASHAVVLSWFEAARRPMSPYSAIPSTRGVMARRCDGLVDARRHPERTRRGDSVASPA